MGNCVGCYRFTEDEFDALFIEFYLVNGFIPQASKLGKHGLPSTTTIFRRRNKTLNEYLMSLGIPLRKRTTPHKSDTEMLNDLRDLADELGRVPIGSDLRGRHGVCGKSTYATRFGSWTNALLRASLDPVWRPLTDDDLVIELKRFYEEHGRSPSVHDSMRYGTATFSTRFGSWNNALRVAGLPLNKSIYGNRTIGKDGVVYDSISESVVADWMLDHGIEYEHHVPYFRKLIADFRVGSIYIEFFGLDRLPEYAKRVDLKRSLCERMGYELIEIYPRDLRNLSDKLGILIGGDHS